MHEVLFIFKSFVMATFILFISQIKIKGVTLEFHVYNNLMSSKAIEFVNKASQGGAKAISDSVQYTKKNYLQAKGTKETLEKESTDSVKGPKSRVITARAFLTKEETIAQRLIRLN